MSKYLYNGIPLPDINTVWTDKTTYPYAIIFGDEYGGEFLHISPVPFIYEDPNVNISSGAGSPRYINDSDGWVEHDSGSGCTGSGVKWTNYDIIDISDNSVYLAASEPVPVNLKSWLIGFALGLAGKPLPFAKNEPVGEPVAYLYGTPSETGNIGLRVGDTVTYYDGAVLPALPEWDKTAYPYASITNLGIYNFLYISSKPHYIADTSGKDALYSLVPNIAYCYETDRSDEGWLRMADNVEHSPLLTLHDFVWSNAPIEKDGTVVHERTNPIPIYNGIVEYINDIPIYE